MPPSSWLYSLSPFPNTSPLMSVITLLCILPYHYNQLNFYSTVKNNQYNLQSIITSFTFSKVVPAELAILGYAVVPILTIMILVSSVYNEDSYEGIRYLLGWVGKRIFPILRILMELNTVIASLFMLIDPYSLILFVISFLVNLALTFLLQNYYIHKDYLCCFSVEYSLWLRLILFTNCILNSIGIWYQSEPFFNALLIIRAILASLLWILYFCRGVTIYRHPLTKGMLMGLILLYVSITLGQFLDQMLYLLNLHDGLFDLIYGGVVGVPLSLLTYTLYVYLREKSLETEHDLRRKVFFFKEKIMNFASDMQDECFVRGLILHHVTNKCSNVSCFGAKESVYDSKRNKHCYIKKLAMNNSTFCNLLIKCWH